MALKEEFYSQPESYRVIGSALWVQDDVAHGLSESPVIREEKWIEAN